MSRITRVVCPLNAMKGLYAQSSNAFKIQEVKLKIWSFDVGYVALSETTQVARDSKRSVTLKVGFS